MAEGTRRLNCSGIVFEAQQRLCARVVLEPQSRERFSAAQLGRSDRTDGCWVRGADMSTTTRGCAARWCP
jgi:hypothetical protein